MGSGRFLFSFFLLQQKQKDVNFPTQSHQIVILIDPIWIVVLIRFIYLSGFNIHLSHQLSTLLPLWMKESHDLPTDAIKAFRIAQKKIRIQKTPQNNYYGCSIEDSQAHDLAFQSIIEILRVFHMTQFLQ